MVNARIHVNPQILGGKPVICGTRISVEFILNLLGAGISTEQILADYPHLSHDDIQACLSYAAHSLRNEIYYDFKKAS